MNDPHVLILPHPSDQAANLPAIVGDYTPRAVQCLEDWFFGEIANDNTRMAYERALRRFAAWSSERRFTYRNMRSLHIREYINQLQSETAPATVKQHLAAIREMFNALMRAGEIDVNPAYSVKAPRMSVTTGKTPVLDAANAKHFLATIDTETIKGKRDKALISLMLYTFARVSAALKMETSDYFQHNDGFHVRLAEKGGKQRTIPAHSVLVELMADYLDAARLRGTAFPLWQTIDRKNGQLSGRRLQRQEVYEIIGDRAQEAGLKGVKYGNHTWRGTGITLFLEGGGAMDMAQDIAGHADPRTTRLYDRRGDRIKQNDIELIRL
jgi:site-specific recombinase XerD